MRLRLKSIFSNNMFSEWSYSNKSYNIRLLLSVNARLYQEAICVEILDGRIKHGADHMAK